MEENNFHEALEIFSTIRDAEVLDMLKEKAVVWEIEDFYDRNAPTLRNLVYKLLN
jgi:hypothetical protein